MLLLKGFSWDLPSITQFFGFIRFSWFLSSTTEFYQDLLSFSGYFWVILGFTGFYWVLKMFFLVLYIFSSLD